MSSLVVANGHADSNANGDANGDANGNAKDAAHRYDANLC